jgi:hypothetical protein
MRRTQALSMTASAMRMQSSARVSSDTWKMRPKELGINSDWQGMRHLALVLSFLFLLPLASYAGANLDQLLQTYAVRTKTLVGMTATLIHDVETSQNADEAATRIESYATVYHEVAQTFQNLMPAFIKSNTAGTVSVLQRQSMLDSSARMTELGKVLTSESDEFDSALKPYQSDPRVSAALTAFLNEGQALQAVAQQYR